MGEGSAEQGGILVAAEVVVMSERNALQVADKLRASAKVAELEDALDAKHAQLVAVADELREERARKDALVAAVEHMVGPGAWTAGWPAVQAALVACKAASALPALPVLWEDTADEWSEAIRAAHPARTGSHDEYATAMAMVGHRHSKGELVALVTWLLASSREGHPRRTAREERSEDV